MGSTSHSLFMAERPFYSFIPKVAKKKNFEKWNLFFFANINTIIKLIILKIIINRKVACLEVWEREMRELAK